MSAATQNGMDKLRRERDQAREERDAMASRVDFLNQQNSAQQEQNDAMAAQVENWEDAAAQFARNADFYQGIVRQIGELFGEEARTSDDGSVQDDVLALKVPELVEALAAHVERQSDLLSSLAKAMHAYEEAMHAYEEDVCDPPPRYHLEMMRDAEEALLSAPTASLARQKAKWQAEALEESARAFRDAPLKANVGDGTMSRRARWKEKQPNSAAKPKEMDYEQPRPLDGRMAGQLHGPRVRRAWRSYRHGRRHGDDRAGWYRNSTLDGGVGMTARFILREYHEGRIVPRSDVGLFCSRKNAKRAARRRGFPAELIVKVVRNEPSKC